MSMDKKEHWIDEAMESDPFNKSRSLPTQLRNQLRDIPNDLETNRGMFSGSTHVWIAAAGIALLISINVIAFNKKQTNERVGADNSIYSAYFSSYNYI
jgi:hypothetical protein